jgi:hypothetical protein
VKLIISGYFIFDAFEAVRVGGCHIPLGPIQCRGGWGRPLSIDDCKTGQCPLETSAASSRHIDKSEGLSHRNFIWNLDFQSFLCRSEGQVDLPLQVMTVVLWKNSSSMRLFSQRFSTSTSGRGYGGKSDHWGGHINSRSNLSSVAVILPLGTFQRDRSIAFGR